MILIKSAYNLESYSNFLVEYTIYLVVWDFLHQQNNNVVKKSSTKPIINFLAKADSKQQHCRLAAHKAPAFFAVAGRQVYKKGLFPWPLFRERRERKALFPFSWGNWQKVNGNVL